MGDRQIVLCTENRHEAAYYRFLTRNSYLPPVILDQAIARKVITPGSRVLDIGANIGFNALLYASLGASRVETFEPDPKLFERLRQYGDDVIHPHPVALSDHEGEMPLYLSQEHNQGNTLEVEVTEEFQWVFGAKPKAVQVKVDTIDRLFNSEGFDFIKVDVEGHELPCLQGAEHMLKTRPPKYLQTESYGEKFVELHAYLKQFFDSSCRVVIRRHDRTVQFRETDFPVEEEPSFDVNPPTFLYSRSEELAFWQ